MYFNRFADLPVLTVHYRYLRQQVVARGVSDVELGPDEQKLRMKSAPEMLSKQQDTEKPCDDLTKKQAELSAFKLPVTTYRNCATTVGLLSASQYTSSSFVSVT